MAKQEHEEPAAEDGSPPDRRTFIQGAACAVGGAITLVPVAAAIRVVMDPLGRKRPNTGGGFTRLCQVSELKPGQPTLFKIMADKTDKWSRYSDTPIGAVWVVAGEAAEGAIPEITAFSTICPHLGCFVNYRETENDFYCPCHNSQFQLTGTRVNETPPRDMDTLEFDKEKLEESGEVWVKYERFKTDTSEKVPA